MSPDKWHNMTDFKYIDHWENEAILEAYNEIKTRIHGFSPDSLNVVKTVINHRNFWKPSCVKTLLLAESHVYTTDDECANTLDYPNYDGFKELPTEFVKLVYCLGYGEQKLVPLVQDNAGTWQFWKIFTACASDTDEFDFDLYQKGGFQSDNQRLINKLNLLRRLVEKAVWLVDSSIVGLYGYGKKPKIEFREMAIEISWDNYISRLLEVNMPEKVIVIGKGVGKVIGSRVDDIGIPHETVPQPQARMTSREIEETHREYQRICNRK